MQISDYLMKSGILLDFPENDKSGFLSAMVDLLAGQIKLAQPGQILQLLEEREKLSTTGIGNGVAVPHCKSPEISELKILIGRSRSGIDFQALDGKPVTLFFLLVAPEQSSSTHLKALAKIARLAKNASVREQLMEFTTSEEIIEFIHQKESEFN